MQPCPECRAVSEIGSARVIFVEASCQICFETRRPFVLLPCAHGMCESCFQHWQGDAVPTMPAPAAPAAPTTNDQGAAVLPGSVRGDWDGRHNLYCGRRLGTAAIPGSDGRCGPNNGPQCQSCKRLQRAVMASMSGQNDERAPVFFGEETNKLYCGRRLGTAAIPGSDGRCGPTNGPQCQSCERVQLVSNDEDAAILPGSVQGTWDGRHNLYCGRRLGRAVIPGSDGRCGPTDGPQCKSCKRFQIGFLAQSWIPCYRNFGCAFEGPKFRPCARLCQKHPAAVRGWPRFHCFGSCQSFRTRALGR